MALIAAHVLPLHRRTGGGVRKSLCTVQRQGPSTPAGCSRTRVYAHDCAGLRRSQACRNLNSPSNFGASHCLARALLPKPGVAGSTPAGRPNAPSRIALQQASHSRIKTVLGSTALVVAVAGSSTGTQWCVQSLLAHQATTALQSPFRRRGTGYGMARGAAMC